MLASAATAPAQQAPAPPSPPPGVLVDVGGHKMHVHCVGPLDARPTVILEAGGGGSSKDWAAVQSLLSPRVRTCAYDRAGSGRSEPGPAPRTMRQEVFELHALLREAKVPGPYVLVGQSIGGLLVRRYAEEYGDEVAGIVLVDPTDENTLVFNLGVNRWVRVRELAKGREVPEPKLRGPAAAKDKPGDDYLADEAQQMHERRLADPQPLAGRPLVVLGAGQRPPPPGMTEEAWEPLRIQRDEQVAALASLSSNSRFVSDPASGHNVHKDNPQAVADAIEAVVNAVAKGAELSDTTARQPRK